MSNNQENPKTKGRFLFTKKSIRRKPFSSSGSLVFFLMSLPALTYLFIFNYLPLAGSVLAFKDYKYNLGIFGSKWVGFENFEFLLTSNDLWRITRNSIGYGVVFIICNTVLALIVALLMYQLTNRIALKIVQTSVILPNFLSWIMVAFIVYIFLNAQSGVVNTFKKSMGFDVFDWYTKASAWPIIIPLIHAWKNVGWMSLVYYSALMQINSELFEAAELDGANKWQQAWNISIPSIAPVIATMSLIAVGTSVIRQDLGLFLQVTRNSGLLYRTTDVIDTYVYRATVQVGDIGMSSAVGLFQTVIGVILVLITNSIIKRMSPESAIF
ncbi:MAG: ABC transporter permease subunit [Spirochaetaceae bacterium]